MNILNILNSSPAPAGRTHLGPRDRAPHVPNPLFWSSWIGPTRVINSVFVLPKHGIIGMMVFDAIA